MRLIDLTGQTYGRLVVVERAPVRKKVTYWLCRCECGTEVVTAYGGLRSGTARSCGCAPAELAMGRRPWFRDSRYLVGEDGSIVGPRGHVLTPTLNDKGYPVIGTRWGGRGQVHEVHVIVTEVFYGPRPEGKQAAHENGVRSDCRAANLSWKTPAENSADRIRHGTQARGEEHGKAKLTDAAVRVIRASAAGSDEELARTYGVHSDTVRSARLGLTWRHVS